VYYGSSSGSGDLFAMNRASNYSTVSCVIYFIYLLNTPKGVHPRMKVKNEHTNGNMMTELISNEI